MSAITIRNATLDDLPFIVSLIDGDEVSAARDPASTSDAQDQLDDFNAIASDPNHLLLVALIGDEPVGSFQLSFIPGVSRRGTWRGQIESVRVDPAHRNKGVGAQMMQWAVEQCRARDCGLVQLTSDRQRGGAHRFYERLGFEPTHTGFKLKLR